MEIKAKCKFDMDSMKALVHLSMFKKADPKQRMRFWTIVYAIIMAFMIFELLIWGKDTTMFVLLGVLVVVYLLESFLYFILPKMRYKALAKMQEAENEYIFLEQVIRCFTKSEEFNSEAEIEYSLFVKVYETSKYFFLFQTNNQVFLVDKSTIEGGTAEDIRNKLLYFVKDKYVVCKY